MTALRVSIAETLSTVHQSQRACPTLWGRVEKLRAFAFALLLIIIIYKNYYLRELAMVVGKDFACAINLCATPYKSVIYTELCMVFMHRSAKAVVYDCP